MKKLLSIILLAVMLIALISGCTSNQNSENNGKLKIIATIFPEYDWVKNVLGDRISDVELALLLDNGTDLHSYQPSAEDILNISTCDLFVYTGGESDKWVDEVLVQANREDMIVVNLLDVVGDAAKEEEVVEGMQGEDEEEEEGEEAEYDEHVWLSLKNAERICGYIADKLGEADNENKEIYQNNSDSYITKLKELDGKFEETVNSSKYNTLIFGDRFPFRYLTDDYNLNYYAAFTGCSAETEASFETVKFLADKLNELKLPSIMTIEKSDNKIAETIIKTSGLKGVNIFSLDSIQSVTKENITNGASYLSIMESNLNVLSKALN